MKPEEKYYARITLLTRCISEFNKIKKRLFLQRFLIKQKNSYGGKKDF